MYPLCLADVSNKYMNILALINLNLEILWEIITGYLVLARRIVKIIIIYKYKLENLSEIRLS